MRKLIAILLLVSHLLIIIGFVWPVVIDKFHRHQSEQSLQQKINLLSPRSSFISMLSEMAKEHEKNKQSKPLPETIISGVAVFNLQNEGSIILSIFISALLIFLPFLIEHFSKVILSTIVPPPKAFVLEN